MNDKSKKAVLKFTGGFIFAFLLLSFAFVSTEAHTYHTSLARMDYNARDKNIEVSIQLFIHDVQPMLERRLKKRVDIAKTAEVDGELFKYISENFVLQNKAGDAQKLNWVGKEFENDAVYVYFEIPFAGDLSGAKLKNTIFFESFPEQTNLVIARWGEKKADLFFKAGDKFKDL